MVDKRVSDYIKKGLKNGYSVGALKKALVKGGWPAAEVNSTINELKSRMSSKKGSRKSKRASPSGKPMPVPKRRAVKDKGRSKAGKGSKGSGDISIRLADEVGSNAEAGEPEAAKDVDKELNEFDRAHADSGFGSANTKGHEEHVDFSHIREEIEKRIGRKGAKKGIASAKDISKVGGMEIIKSGIKGLDKVLNKGIPEQSLILLSGTCGTGKSIFGMNFLIGGAMRGEPGIYISLEESPQGNIEQMKMFGWPVDKMIKEEKLMILQPELYNFDALLTTIEDSVNKINAKRLVIDSISIIGLYFEDPYKVRKSLLQLSDLLKKLKCTTIAIDEIKEGDSCLSSYGVEEFVVDGVIVMYLIKRSNMFIRAIVIRKMRGLDHSTKIHPMDIKSPGGIVIYPAQELFEEIK